ncbi:MAG: cell division protein MukB, partial [Clostridiales bacterium]|nr:cell division protein MukB [Clostridiales bacterium]
GNTKSLQNEIGKLEVLLKTLASNDELISSKAELNVLLASDPIEMKSEILITIEKRIHELVEEYNSRYYGIESNIKEITQEIKDLEHKITDLNKKIFQYPVQTEKLKKSIEDEFKKRGIDSKVWVVSQLLEVTDPLWQDAVEGYFNTQKFNIIVEPQYFDMALSVYKRHQKEIYGAGIINTKKLELNKEVDSNSLAYVVHSENRYAKAYATYVLGRVIRCEKIQELENHRIAITPDCMLYQGYVVRNIDRDTYKNPFIGSNAINIQLMNAREEIEQKQKENKLFKEEREDLKNILDANRDVDIKEIRKVLDSPAILLRLNEEICEKSEEFKSASKDANYISLTTDIEELTKDKKDLKWKIDVVTRNIAEYEIIIRSTKIEIEDIKKEQDLLDSKLQEDFQGNTEAKEEASKKYQQNRKTKSPKTIVDNFIPRSSQYRNEKEELLNESGGLTQLQDQFNHTYDQDYIRGVGDMNEYYEAKRKLDTSEIVKYDEDIKKAKEACEEIFRVSFLAKMKENIENAKLEFRNLNKALKDIYYGEDSYYFEISYDKKKESLYKMITSESNFEGYNLWSSAFEEEYKEEMSDLFAKLTAKDDRGSKVIDEYTDYRSFLDYDIEVRKKDGTRQKFSKIYGEKSGGETQTPYYVAIAASFYQLYKMDNTIRIILLDEAFDKMDDNRIGSMMDFFNSLNLQVILATPPAKIEVIGEKLNTILMAMRGKRGSFIHEYEL